MVPGYLSRHSDQATGLTIKNSWLVFRKGQKTFLFSNLPKQALRPTQPTIQWVPMTCSSGATRSARGSNHASPSSAEIKDKWNYTFTPPYVSTACKATLPLTNLKASDYKPLMLAATCITSCGDDVRVRPVCEWVRHIGCVGGRF